MSDSVSARGVQRGAAEVPLCGWPGGEADVLKEVMVMI